MARASVFVFCAGLTLAGCAGTNDTLPDSESLLNETTLTRYEGTSITLEELESIRYSAIATAVTIARIERELHEPWAETRTAEEILRAVHDREPSDMRLATTLWETAEPKGAGRGRAAFQEYGFYSNQFMPMDFSPRVKPRTLEKYTQGLLEKHDDETPAAKLLAAWRHLSPLVSERADEYLASSWLLELDYIKPIKVQVVESLMGPHHRSTVVDDGGVSFPGPDDSYEGYSASPMLLDLLAPGSDSPVTDAITALSELSEGRSVRLPFSVRAGRQDATDKLDEAFVKAVLSGLKAGSAELEALPGATSRVTVTFSYLVELGEARATLSLQRNRDGWELDLFDYEPAAASLVGGDARLDLLPDIRALIKRSRGR